MVMSKFSAFSITELRSLQNVLSSYIENIRSDVVSEDGEILSVVVDENKAEELNLDCLLQESLLRQLEVELSNRLSVAV